MTFLDLHPKKVNEPLKPLHKALNEVKELEHLEEHDLKSLKNLEKMLDQLYDDVKEGKVEIREIHMRDFNDYLERAEENLQILEAMVKELMESLKSE